MIIKREQRKSSEDKNNSVRKLIASFLQLLRCLKLVTRHYAITVVYLTPIYNSFFLSKAMRKLRRLLRKSGKKQLI